MSGGVLALSPHLDDAVFSAGATLGQRAAGGAEVVVATLFTGNVERPSGFALACQLDKGLGPEIDYMALRRDEDAVACARLGCAFVHRQLLEAPHRGYGSAASLFGPPHQADDAWESLCREISLLLAAHAPGEVFAPRALGGHVDHVLLHRALRRVAPGRPVSWWTDWPYADRPDSPDPEAFGLEAVTVDEPVSLVWRRRKAEACAAYASQLGFQFGGENAMRVRVLKSGGERFAVSGAVAYAKSLQC